MSRPDSTTPASDRPARPGLRRLELVLAAVLLLLLVLLLAWDWDWLRGPIENRVSQLTGRAFHIDGPISGRLGWQLQLRAEELRLGNPDWARREHMGLADALEVELTVAQLLGRRVGVMRLERPRLSLERNEAGAVNWRFDGLSEGGWDIDDLLIDEGRMELREPQLETEFSLRVRSGERREQLDRAPLLITGSGTFRGVPFDVRGGMESPLELRDQDRPFRLGLRIEAADTRARVRGTLHSWIDLTEFDLALQMEGADLADLFPLLRIAMPTTADYQLEGQLVRDNDSWEYRDIEGRIGQSDIAGDVSIDVAPERPMLQAELRSDSLYFPDLAGFIGVTPGQGDVERQRSGRLFPTATLSGERLRSMDADVHLVATALTSAPVPMDTLDARLLMDDGLMRIDPLIFEFAGGDARGDVTLDAREMPATARTSLQLRSIELPRLMGEDLGDGTRGSLAGRVELAGRGNSVADILGGSDGDIQLVMGPGHVGPARLAAWNLDGWLPSRALGSGDDGLRLNCAVADFAVAGGVATPRLLGVDAADTVVLGDGELLLGTERLDLVIQTRPKQTGLLALRAPVRVHGRFLAPEIDVDAGPLLLRGLAAAVLYAIAPPATLLALIETGESDAYSCFDEDD